MEWVSDTDSIGVDVGALGWADPDAGCASRSGSSLPADPAAPGVRENRTGRPAPSHGRRCMEGTSLRSHRYTGRFRLRLGPHAECRVVSGPRRLSPIGRVTGVKWRRYPPHLDPHSESIGSDNCLVKIFAIASHPGDPPHTAADGLSQIPLSVQRIFAQEGSRRFDGVRNHRPAVRARSISWSAQFFDPCEQWWDCTHGGSYWCSSGGECRGSRARCSWIQCPGGSVTGVHRFRKIADREPRGVGAACIKPETFLPFRRSFSRSPFSRSLYSDGPVGSTGYRLARTCASDHERRACCTTGSTLFRIRYQVPVPKRRRPT